MKESRQETFSPQQREETLGQIETIIEHVRAYFEREKVSMPLGMAALAVLIARAAAKTSTGEVELLESLIVVMRGETTKLVAIKHAGAIGN